MDHDKEFKHVRKYVVTFKSVAFISLVFGLYLLSTCFWILIAFSEHDAASSSEETNPTAANFRLLAILVNQKQGGDPTERGGLLENDEISGNFSNSETDKELEMLQKKFVHAWNSVSPYFQGACGLAVVSGLVQVVACMAILSSSTKGAGKPFRLRLWKVLHFCLIITFLICIAIPVSIDKSLKDGGIADHLDALAAQLKRHNAPSLDTEDVDNIKLLYIALAGDAVGCTFLVVIGHFVLSYVGRATR
ncbi:uncharacterized protein LOC110859145 [Folsomia candida]|uniref:uncharacterized protein LOC110859145 n=1 Tax=Folsomia candida TaxID=158441 RepID=UPI000B906A5D|nr:uncharacterized protein LOC110859145 [Folsomia candida]